MGAKVKYTVRGKDVSGDEFERDFMNDVRRVRAAQKAEQIANEINAKIDAVLCPAHGQAANVTIEIREDGSGMLFVEACCKEFHDKSFSAAESIAKKMKLV